MKDAVEPTVRKVESFVEGFFWILPNLGVAILVFLLFLAGAWLAKWIVSNTARRRDRGDLGILLGSFVRWVVIVLGVLVVATIVFPSVKPADVLATLGFGSVAIGFAFKDILQNWLSGLLILYRQPFRRDDQIRSGEFEGTVERIEARATLIKTYDGQRVVIPNTDIYTRAVTVRTAFPKRRSEYDVGIGYGDDVNEACRLIRAAVGTVEGVENDPVPEAVPWALDASSVNIKVRWWSDSQRSSIVHVQGRVITAIKQTLTVAGVDLPFPTRVVLFHDQTEESDGDRTRQREGWPKGRIRLIRGTSTKSGSRATTLVMKNRKTARGRRRTAMADRKTELRETNTKSNCRAAASRSLTQRKRCRVDPSGELNVSKAIPNNALVVVADGRKAIMFRNEGAGADVSFREELRLSPKDLLDDGPSGARPVEQTPRQTDEATFAKQLAETLYGMKQSGQFEALVLVADPQTLGQLRDTMHKIVETSVVSAIAKDLTNHSAGKIADALK